MSYIAVGLGGVLGSVSRYALGKSISRYNRTTFPWATFLINVLGALLLGVVSAIHAGNMLYWTVGEGFLGAFTTFSTFMYEGFSLFNNNKYLNAFIYIATTIVLGIAGYSTSYFCIISILLK